MRGRQRRTKAAGILGPVYIRVFFLGIKVTDIRMNMEMSTAPLQKEAEARKGGICGGRATLLSEGRRSTQSVPTCTFKMVNRRITDLVQIRQIHLNSKQKGLQPYHQHGEPIQTSTIVHTAHIQVQVSKKEINIQTKLGLSASFVF